ncbi:MAG: signal peptidase I [Anaerolineales bacterium]|nr:signal peptidase I [Anaerolineales bacterium]
MEAIPAQSEIPTTPVKPKESWWRFLLDLLETFLIAIVLFLGINAVSARVRVDGMSMYPTLENGQYVLVNRLAYRSALPEFGDIIVFRFPINPDQDFIKRVIGLPGDVVEVEAGQVIVNGLVEDEPYIAAAPRYSGRWHVQENQLFVLGDNRNDSSDSHSWGLVPMENVIGKAIVIYWPPPKWMMIEHVQAADTPQ